MTLGPLPPVASTLRIVIGQQAASRAVVNILHWQYTGTPPSNATCAAIAASFQAGWQNNISSLQISTTTLNSVIVTDLTSPTAGEGEVVLATPFPGARGDDPIGNNTSMLISYAVNGRFRGGHPRTYLNAGGHSDIQDPAHWHTAFVTETTTKWSTFLTSMNGISTGGTTFGQFCAVRYHGKFLPNSGPPAFRLLTPVVLPLAIAHAAAQGQMASQRRRIGRVRK